MTDSLGKLIWWSSCLSRHLKRKCHFQSRQGQYFLRSSVSKNSEIVACFSISICSCLQWFPREKIMIKLMIAEGKVSGYKIASVAHKNYDRIDRCSGINYRQKIFSPKMPSADLKNTIARENLNKVASQIRNIFFFTVKRNDFVVVYLRII